MEVTLDNSERSSENDSSEAQEELEGGSAAAEMIERFEQFLPRNDNESAEEQSRNAVAIVDHLDEDDYVAKENENDEDEEPWEVVQYKIMQQMGLVPTVIDPNQLPKPELDLFYEIDDETAPRIGQALSFYTFVKVVQFRLKRSLTAEGAQHIVDGLRQSRLPTLELGSADGFLGPIPTANVTNLIVEAAVQSVQDLKLDMKLTDEVGNRLAERLHGNITLKKLELRIGLGMTNNGAEMLGEGFRRSQLKQLVLGSDQGINRNIMRILHREALASVPDCFLWDQLNNTDASLVGEALLGNTLLKSLRITINSDLSQSAATGLALGIANSKLVHLEVGGPYQHAVYAEVEDIIYSHGVRNCHSIRHLSIMYGIFSASLLRGCLTGGSPQLIVLQLDELLVLEQVQHLCAVLPQLASLRLLSMKCDIASKDTAGNAVATAGAENFMTAVANHPSLVNLNLTNCSDVSFAGLEMIGRHLPNVKLQKLIIERLNDEYDQFDRSAKVQKAYHKACQELVDGVRANVTLRVLNVKLLHLPSRVGRAINFYLKINKTGRYLLQEEVSLGLWCLVLGNKCRDEAGLMYYYLREQPQLLLGAAV